MKPTMIRMSDACEVAFMGFALDVQDNGAGLWDGEQDAEATRALDSNPNASARARTPAPSGRVNTSAHGVSRR